MSNHQSLKRTKKTGSVMEGMQDTIHYLTELRRRVLRCLLVIGAVFIAFAFMADDIYHWFSLPIMRHLPEHKGLIATSVPAPFTVPFKSALVLAIYLTVPYWLYEIWSFVAPALYRKERKLGWVFLLLGVGLFYLGTLFAYFVVMPMVFHFFIQVAPASVDVKPDISKYFSFIMRMFFAFGLSFELPVIILLLVYSGVTSTAKLARKRPYIIIAAFVAAMLLTPPDIFSQVLLAIPIWLLFELGLLLARIMVPVKRLDEGDA